MASIMSYTLFKRDNDSSFSNNSTVIQLLTALVVLAGLGLSLSGILFIIRQWKKKNSPVLPTHTRNHSLTVTPIPYRTKRTSFFGSAEKKTVSPPSTPTSPVPEIRITFPEEETADGKRKSGRVVIVQVGEAGAAFVRDVEPENDLPPYQKKGQFEAVDLEKVGGLKEKEFS